jgi:hypothetical protein
MNLSSFDYFILGILVSIPVTVIGGLYTTRLQQRLAQRSEKRAMVRITLIKEQYEEAKRYRDNPGQMMFFAVRWIFWLTIYWILEELLGNLFSFGSNGAYFANQNGVASLINTISSLVTVMILTYIFRSGYRAFQLVHRVEHFDDFEKSYLGELSRLGQVRDEKQDPPPAAPGGEPSGDS